MNIVLIVADDMRFDLIERMKSVQWLAGQPNGMLMKNGYNQNPVCIPARTSILTGNYSRTTGVVDNGQGFETFDDSKTIAKVLSNSGYFTGHFGKYVNNYNPESATYIPPGWDRWWAITEGGSSYYDYQVSDQGVTRVYGHRPEHYLTSVISARAEKFVSEAPEPFFAYVAPVAPHEAAVPYPRHATMNVDLPQDSPAFNEADTSDKPYTGNKLDQAAINALRKTQRNQIRTIQGLDDLIFDIWTALVNRGVTQRTMFVFVSDNGFQWGEHRFVGKSLPYQESVRMAMLIVDPRVTKNKTNDAALIQNVDLAPTFAATAGVPFENRDGDDVSEALFEGGAGRPDLFIEGTDRNRRPGFTMLQGKAFAYSGQTPLFSYIKWDTGKEEWYDLRSDPYQLSNEAGVMDLAPYRARLATYA